MGESRAMRELKALIASVAPTEANVMVLGENGVGKELVARAIHAASRRASARCWRWIWGRCPSRR
jgi:DNA-binding NtrC family response regulator